MEKKKKFEEKILAESFFKGKKKSYDKSISYFFESNRLSEKQNQLMTEFQKSHSMSDKFVVSLVNSFLLKI